MLGETIVAIDRETHFAQEKYGKEKELGKYLLVLEEELHEAKLDFIKGRTTRCLQELLQVASVAVNAIEQHGVHERWEKVSDA